MKHFFSIFSQLPLSNKSMVYLMWIYETGIVITNVFINIYIFQINQSLVDVAWYNIVYYGMILVWFSGIGWIMAYLWKNIKYMYYIGYVMFITSFIPLIFWHNSYEATLLFALLYGLWSGTFWNAVHSQELKNIHDKYRDFYSSAISAGVNIIHIFIPLVVAFLFYTSWIFQINAYVIIFFLLPITYLLSFVFIHNIADYIPKQITTSDVGNFLNFKKYWFGHIYYCLGGFGHGLESVIIPIITILLLKNEINVWLFQWAMSIVSTFCVIYFASRRTIENRMYYFFFLSVLLFLNYFLFSLFFGLISFIIFSFILLLLKPIFRVSSHTYDLSLMDNVKTDRSDFYPSMILREIILAFGRFSAIWIIIVLFHIGYTTQILLQAWIALIWCKYILKSILIYLWEKYEKQ